MKKTIIIYTVLFTLIGLTACQTQPSASPHLSNKIETKQIQSSNQNNAQNNQNTSAEDDGFKVKNSVVNHQGCTITEYENGSIDAVCP